MGGEEENEGILDAGPQCAGSIDGNVAEDEVVIKIVDGVAVDYGSARRVVRVYM